MLSKKVSTAKTGKDSASCFQVSNDSHQSTTGRGFFTCSSSLLLAAIVLMAACDPVTGTGSGTQPDPKKYIRIDAATKSAVVTLIAGYPATDFQFNYDGYGDGSLILKVPLGWQVTVQCANRSTVNNSCAVVSDAAASEPMQPSWSTPDPQHGLGPGESASFVFIPATTGAFRIASLVRGSEASGMWLDLEVVDRGTPSLTVASTVG